MSLLVLLAYGAFALALYPQVVLQGQSFYRPDIYTFYYPVWRFASESLRAGIFPLWNPYNAFGAPFFANVQTCVLYPGAVLYYLLPFDLGFNLYILFHLTLACSGTFQLARKLGLTKMGAFLAGLLFGLSGYVSSSLHLVITLASVAYFPWALLAMMDLQENVSKKSVLQLAGILVLQYLAGDPSIIFMTSLVILIATGYRLIDTWNRTRTFNGGLFKGLILSFLIFAGLSAFQSVSFIEFVRASTREGQSLEDVATWSAQWETIASFFIPRFHDLASMVAAEETLKVVNFGVRKQVWLSDPYLGIVPLLFALYALAVHRKPRTLALGLMAVLSIGLAFGDRSLLYLALYHVLPGLQWVRFPVRFLFPAYLAIALLAATGAEAIAFRSSVRKISGLWFLLALILTAAIVTLNSGAFFSDLCARAAEMAYKHEAISDHFSAENLRRVLAQTASSMQRSSFFLFIALLLFLIRGRRNKFLVLFCLVAVCDLVPINAVEPTGPSELLRSHGPVIDRLCEDRSLFRSMPSPRMVKKIYEVRNPGPGEVLEQAEKLSPNLPMLFKLHLVWNYDSVFLKSAIAGQKLLVRSTLQEAQDWMSLLNVKYLLSTEGSLTENFTKIEQGSAGFLFQNHQVLPRAYWVPEEAVDANNDLIPSVVLTQHKPATIVDYDLNRVSLTADCPESGWLFLSDTQYPGWNVRVDGQRARSLSLNGDFRSVRLGPGPHKVEWMFMPGSVVIGACVTLLTTLGLLLWRKY